VVQSRKPFGESQGFRRATALRFSCGRRHASGHLGWMLGFVLSEPLTRLDVLGL
jgi:hypothetical protein